MGISIELIKRLNELGIQAGEADYKKCGYHLEVFPKKDQVREFAALMLESEFYLGFVSAVHVESALQAIYQFAHFSESCHVNAKVITENDSVPTISDIFHGAAWHERETHDFYGLKFEGNKDLRVLILAEDDADLKPLLKNKKKLKSLEGITRKKDSDDKADKKSPKSDEKEE